MGCGAAVAAGFTGTFSSLSSVASNCFLSGLQTAPNRPFLSLVHLSNASPSLLAASSADRTISVYDTRILSSPSSSTTPIAILSPTSSTSGLPTALAPSPTQPNHLASGGSDGAVRVWDIRATRAPLAGFRAGPNKDSDGAQTKADKNVCSDSKVLALSWARGLLAAGGEAGLDIWRVPEPGA